LDNICQITTKKNTTVPFYKKKKIGSKPALETTGHRTTTWKAIDFAQLDRLLPGAFIQLHAAVVVLVEPPAHGLAENSERASTAPQQQHMLQNITLASALAFLINQSTPTPNGQQAASTFRTTRSDFLTSELCRQCLHQHSSTALMPLPVSVWS
jgi:hypothetical protein